MANRTWAGTGARLGPGFPRPSGLVRCYPRGGGGQDVVMDFNKGEDILLVSRNINGLHVTSAADLASRVVDAGGHAVIDLGNGDTITLMNVSAHDIQQNPQVFFAIG